MNPLDLLNIGSHGVLVLVIIYLLKLITDLLAEIRRLTDVIINLHTMVEDEIVASGGLPSRRK